MIFKNRNLQLALKFVDEQYEQCSLNTVQWTQFRPQTDLSQIRVVEQCALCGASGFCLPIAVRVQNSRCSGFDAVESAVGQLFPQFNFQFYCQFYWSCECVRRKIIGNLLSVIIWTRLAFTCAAWQWKVLNWVWRLLFALKLISTELVWTYISAGSEILKMELGLELEELLN